MMHQGFPVQPIIDKPSRILSFWMGWRSVFLLPCLLPNAGRSDRTSIQDCNHESWGMLRAYVCVIFCCSLPSASCIYAIFRSFGSAGIVRGMHLQAHMFFGRRCAFVRRCSRCICMLCFHSTGNADCGKIFFCSVNFVPRVCFFHSGWVVHF